MTLLLITGLPILSILQFIGGVDPELMLAGFAAVGLTMLGIASVSILLSTLFQKPRDAISLTYLCLIAYGAWPVFGRICRSHPWMTHAALVRRESTELMDAARSARRRQSARCAISTSCGPSTAAAPAAPHHARRGIARHLRAIAWFHLGLAAICIAWSIIGLRAIALDRHPAALAGGSASAPRSVIFP